MQKLQKNKSNAKSSCINFQTEDHEHSNKTPNIFQSTSSAITHSLISPPIITIQENLNRPDSGLYPVTGRIPD